MASSSWKGEIVTPVKLGLGMEERIMTLTRGKPAILPYRRFEPDRRSVLLIHGVGHPVILGDLAMRLDEVGLQVWFVLYDELNRRPHLSGRMIAAKLTEMREQCYPIGWPLDIVAHSLGGVVARCTLNELQDPSWCDRLNSPVGPPRAGFGNVRLRTIDTPWAGFGPESPDVNLDTAPDAKIVQGFMKIFRAGGAFELAAGSRTFKRLYDVQLEQVEIQNLVAFQPGLKNWVPSMPELSPHKMRSLARAIAYGKMPRNLRLRNLCLSLRQDSRFENLKELLLQAIKEGSIDLLRWPSAKFVRRMVRIHDRAMPRFKGMHVSIALDRLYDVSDLVDHIVEELAIAPVESPTS